MLSITTEPYGSFSVDCSDSEALVSLTIWTGIYSDQVTARFRSNENLIYAYSVPKGEALPTLGRVDSAGKFMAWVKAVADTFYRMEV
jgi:hypothetical protein